MAEAFAEEPVAARHGSDGAVCAGGRNGQTVLLSMDQTDLGDRMAVLMVGLRVGDRALPLAWLPDGAGVLLSADRFYPSADLFAWLHEHRRGYRLRLKGNLLVDPGYGDEVTTGALAQGVTERYLPGVRLFAQGVMTNLGILHEAGHPEPWIIAMDCASTRAAVLDYGARWAIEPMFADFKGRGFELEDSQLEHADRLERPILIMSLAMHWCVRVGRDDALNSPTPLEKNARAK